MIKPKTPGLATILVTATKTSFGCKSKGNTPGIPFAIALPIQPAFDTTIAEIGKIKRTLKGAYRDVLMKEWEFANSLIDEFKWDRETFGLRFVVKEKFLSLKYDQVYNEVLNVVMEIPKALK